MQPQTRLPCFVSMTLVDCCGSCKLITRLRAVFSNGIPQSETCHSGSFTLRCCCSEAQQASTLLSSGRQWPGDPTCQLSLSDWTPPGQHPLTALPHQHQGPTPGRGAPLLPGHQQSARPYRRLHLPWTAALAVVQQTGMRRVCADPPQEPAAL